MSPASGTSITSQPPYNIVSYSGISLLARIIHSVECSVQEIPFRLLCLWPNKHSKTRRGIDNVFSEYATQHPSSRSEERTWTTTLWPIDPSTPSGTLDKQARRRKVHCNNSTTINLRERDIGATAVLHVGETSRRRIGTPSHITKHNHTHIEHVARRSHHNVLLLHKGWQSGGTTTPSHLPST